MTAHLTHRHRRLRRHTIGVASLALLAAGVSALATSPASAGAQTSASASAPAARPATTAPPSKTVPATEHRQTSRAAIADMVRTSRPLPVPVAKGIDLVRPQDGPGGPERRFEGALGSASTNAAGSKTASAAAAAQNGPWTGGYASNPNRQVGKLFYDVAPGAAVDWRHCTATAINSENKSLLITAGHCVYNPDPDQNGIVSGNGYWYEQVRFCPGYENGCRLGVWYSRNVSTTSSWFYGVNGRYDYRDDVAVVLVSPNASGRVVNTVGGQGITFNAATGLQRHAFGYPAADYRWPAYSYNGEDLIYCPGRDTNDSSVPGTMWMACTMTGGASGGPWLTSPNSGWMGYVNSVNSHKPYGGPYMSGPYFGNAERDLFQYWRAR